MEKTLRTLKIIHVSFLAAGFVYLIVGYALSNSWRPIVADMRLQQILFYVFLAVSIGLAFAGMRSKDLSGHTSQTGNEAEFARYAVSRFMIAFALAEAPAIFGLVAFLLTGKFSYLLILWAVSFVAFLLLRPSAEVFRSSGT